MKRHQFPIIAIATLLLSGCAFTSDFTAMSSKNVNLDDLHIDKSQSKGRVTGEDCQYIIIFVPTGGPPTLEEAADRAVEPVNAQLLTDVRVKYSTFYLPLLFGQTCWTVEGDAYDTFAN